MDPREYDRNSKRKTSGILAQSREPNSKKIGCSMDLREHNRISKRYCRDFGTVQRA